MRLKGSYSAGLAILIGASAVHGADALDVPFIDAAPVIDGILDDRVWAGARTLTGFVQTRPADNAPASRDTQVLLAYDAAALYVAVRAADDPRHVRATLAKRDDILADDHVRFFLDTYDDKRRAYLVAFNPLGVQQDGLWVEGVAEADYSFDLVMESRGRVTDSGYDIEARIPFRSLRYRAGAGRSWGLHVQRVVKHLDQEDSWRPLIRGRTSFLDQAGAIGDFARLDAERSIELIPTVTASQFGARGAGRFVERAPDYEPSLTAKLSLSSSLVVDAAVNPDFAQIESDALVVTANQRFPIFFEEKRPFFLEGIDLFKTPLSLVDTRRIVAPDVAGKLTGKTGDTTFGLLLARDGALRTLAAGTSTSATHASAAVVRLRRDVGAGSNIGVLGTFRRASGRENVLASADGRFQFGAGTVLSFQGAATHVDATGFGYRVQGLRKTRHLTTTLTAEGRSPRYAADLGYTRQTDTNSVNLDTRFDSEPRPGRSLISWSVLHTGHVLSDWRGRMKYAYVYPGFELAFPKETKVQVRGYVDYLRVFPEELGGPFIGRQERRTVYHGATLTVESTPLRSLSMVLLANQEWNNFDYDFGAPPRFPRVSPAALTDPSAPLDPGPGRALYLEGTLRWKPTEALRGTFGYTKSDLVRNDTGLEAFDQSLFSFTISRQFGRFGFCRLRTDYDTLQSQVRGQVVAGFSPSPGTAVYFGYDDDLRRNAIDPLTGRVDRGLVREGRTLFLKLSYRLDRRL